MTTCSKTASSHAAPRPIITRATVNVNQAPTPALGLVEHPRVGLICGGLHTEIENAGYSGFVDGGAVHVTAKNSGQLLKIYRSP
jgi:hypothetical protein